MAAPLPRCRSAGFRTLAYALAALVGCTTVRAPVSTIAPTIPVQDGRPEPQLELWLEGNRPATPEESAHAAAQVRAVLDEALAGRAPDVPDEMLVVRVQGVTRTPARRSDQHAAVAGIVVGAVVIIAAVVVLIVASSKGGGGSSPGFVHVGAPSTGSGAHAARVAPAAAAARFPRFHPAPAPIATPARPPYPGRLPAIRPTRPHPSDVAVTVAWNVEVPLGPAGPMPPAPPEGYLNAQPPPERPADGPSPDALELPPALAAGADVAGLGAPGEPPPIERLELPPPPPLAVGERGFFAGDAVVIEGILVDRASGRPRWQKVVERPVDPRDPEGMKAAVDALLDERDWVPAF